MEAMDRRPIATRNRKCAQAATVLACFTKCFAESRSEMRSRFASTANGRTGWSQIAARVESCVRALVAQSRAA
jgi:hypothetical protein